MSAEQYPLSEQAQAAIDSLAVLAVQMTTHSGPEVDVGSFVSNVTGLPLEDVDARIQQITSDGEEAFLVRDPNTNELRVNHVNDSADILADAVTKDELVVGDQRLSMSGLGRLLAEHQRNQIAVNAAAAAQRRFGGNISFKPEDEPQNRSFLDQEFGNRGGRPARSFLRPTTAASSTQS